MKQHTNQMMLQIAVGPWPANGYSQVRTFASLNITDNLELMKTCSRDKSQKNHTHMMLQCQGNGSYRYL